MKPKSPNPVPALMILAGLVLLVVWAALAIGTDDALWFLPRFTHDAAAFDLYWDGASVRLEPGSKGYALLNEALKQDLAGVRAYPDTVGLSDASLETLRQSGRLLEAYYSQPVRVHSRYNFGPSTVFYLPIGEREAALARVFNSGRGAPIELKSNTEVVAAARAVAAQSGLATP